MDLATLKLEQVAGFLDRGPVLLNIDGRACSGLPAEHRDTVVALRIGYDLRPDCELVLGVLGFNAVLSFNGERYAIQVPWLAVFTALSEAEPRMITSWPDSVPQADVEPTRPAPRTGLKLVD